VNVAAKPIMGSATDERTMMVGCIRTPHAVISYPVSFRDVHADAAFGARMFTKMGVEAGSIVMFTSGSSEYAHFWPYEIAVSDLEGCVAIAENFIFDAGRSEMFMRRLPVKVAFGITEAILDGMDALKNDEKKKEIAEDEHKRLDAEVQKLTDDTIKEIDAAAHSKEQEILGK